MTNILLLYNTNDKPLPVILFTGAKI